LVPLAHQMSALGQRVQALGEGQERLAGGLHHVSEVQAKAQTNMLQLMEQRFALVQQHMNENLHGAAHCAIPRRSATAPVGDR